MNKYFHFYGDKKVEDIFNKSDIIAIQKLSKGVASESEQQLAYKSIVEKLCRVPHSSFSPDNNITNFNEGVRWVGIMFAQAMVADIDKFK